MSWQKYEAELIRRLEGGPPALRLPPAPPPGVAGFFWRLLRALEGDAASLEEARRLAEGRGAVPRYLVEAVAHRAFPERYPPPAPELVRAWRAYQRGKHLFAVLERPRVEVLPPAASLPLAAGGGPAQVPVSLRGKTWTAGLRFGGIEARPFEVLVELPEEAWAALDQADVDRARVYYRAPEGEAWAEAEAMELFPEEGLLVLSFPEFWLYDVNDLPQDERVITRVELY